MLWPPFFSCFSLWLLVLNETSFNSHAAFGVIGLVEANIGCQYLSSEVA